MVQHLVAFHNLLLDIIGLQKPVMKFVRRDGLDGAQNPMQIPGEVGISWSFKN